MYAYGNHMPFIWFKKQHVMIDLSHMLTTVLVIFLKATWPWLSIQGWPIDAKTSDPRQCRGHVGLGTQWEIFSFLKWRCTNRWMEETLHNSGKSPFRMGKLTINHYFSIATVDDCEILHDPKNG